MRECGTKDGTGGGFWRPFTKEFHPPIATTEPHFVGACREKQRFLFPQLAPGIAWRDNLNPDLGGLSETDLSTLPSTPFFGHPGDIHSFNSLSRRDRAFCDYMPIRQ